MKSLLMQPQGNDYEFLDSIPSSSRIYAAAWLCGIDLKLIVPRQTFYRQSKLLLQYGLNVKKPRFPSFPREALKKSDIS